MALDAVPPPSIRRRVRGYLAGCPASPAVHDLHIWPMSTTETALTAHLVIPAGHPGDEFLATVASELKRRFGIGHTTLANRTSADCVPSRP